MNITIKTTLLTCALLLALAGYAQKSMPQQAHLVIKNVHIIPMTSPT